MKKVEFMWARVPFNGQGITSPVPVPDGWSIRDVSLFNDRSLQVILVREIPDEADTEAE